ncbi:MAG: HAD family phosphatase [bacterium]
MNNSVVKIVVFDIGGVMINLAHSWAAACEFAGIDFRPFDFTPEQKQKFAQLITEDEINAITTCEFMEQLSTLLGNLYSVAELERINYCIIREEFPGMLEFVQELKEHGLRTACLSNTNALHWPALTDPSLYPAIAKLDERYASHLLGARKPDVQIYRLFESLEHLEPQDILFFDDRADNVEAAIAAGWHAVQILPDTPPVEQMRQALELLSASAPCCPSPRG